MGGGAVPERWDEEWDVVVVGCGYAGGMAAIEAHDAGARVVVIEKMPDPGGISVCSAGGVRIADEIEPALAYLRATNADTAPDDVLRVLAEGMTRLVADLERLAAVSGATVDVRRATANYPLPGHDRFGFASIDDVPGFDAGVDYPQVKGSPRGARLFRVVEDNLRARRIDVRLATPAHRLIPDDRGRVAGLLAGDGRTLAARRGVVLACGGFEGNPRMQRQYWQGQPVRSAAFRGNTGDGIRMAQDLGADLWHMWHYHGSYGFRHTDPAYPFAVRTKRLPDWLPGRGPSPDVKMPWILLDRSGRRFMNEYEPYLQDTGHRPMERFQPETQAFRALPAWLVADEDGRTRYPFGRPTYNERGVRFDWSEDNLREVDLGILGRAADLAELAAGVGVDPPCLTQTLERWNRACDQREDEDFGRPFTSMMPVRTAPYYYAQVWPVVSNTQGGPIHDAGQRVIDAYGTPIPRLFVAGELGSVFGRLYLAGGNLAECFVGGRIAGRAAAGAVGMDG